MAGEANQMNWRGIRPTNPEEDIPVKQATAANLKSEIVPASGAVFAVHNTNDDNGVQYVAENNPAGGAILVDTGQLLAGVYDFQVSMASTVNHFYYSFEHRNAANNGTLGAWYMCIIAYNSIWLPVYNLSIATDERLRVRLINSLTGSQGTTISWARRSTA